MPWCLWSAGVTNSPHCSSTLLSLHLSCTPSVKYICWGCHIVPSMYTGLLRIYRLPEISCAHRYNLKPLLYFLYVSAENELGWLSSVYFIPHCCLFTPISHPPPPQGTFRMKYFMFGHLGISRQNKVCYPEISFCTGYTLLSVEWETFRCNNLAFVEKWHSGCCKRLSARWREIRFKNVHLW